MLISALLETTTPITIERGAIKFTLDCTLEKISTQNPEYAQLVEAENDMRFDTSFLQANLTLYFNEDWRGAQLLETVAEGEEERMPTRKEMEKRGRELDKEIKKAAQDLVSGVGKLMKAQAARIAYLTKSWDLMESENVMLPVTVENIVAHMNETLIAQIIAEIEAAVDGPLGRRNAITS